MQSLLDVKMELNLKLRTRILLLSLVPMISMTVILSCFIGVYLILHANSQLASHAKTIGTNIANSLEYSVQTQNLSEMNRIICFGITSSIDVSSIQVSDNSGRPIATCKSKKSFTGNFVSQEFPIYSIRSQDSSTVDEADLNAPIKALKVGLLRVTLSSQATNEDLNQLAVGILCIFTLVVFLGVFFSILNTKRLIAAMNEMSHAAKHVTDRNYHPVFKYIMDGEFGELQKAFIEMFISLNSFTERLDKEVEQKTKFLVQQKQIIEDSHLENKLLIKRSNEAIENERRTIAFDLHDTLNTLVLSIIGHARQAKTELQRFNNHDLVMTTDVHLDEVKDSAGKLYSLSRDLVSNLRPEVLDEFGLGEALKDLTLKQQKADNTCNYTYYCTPNFPILNYEFNIVVYRIVQESLSNVQKHAKATCCEVELVYSTQNSDKRIEVSITDDGVGFAPVLPKGRTGIVGMRQRAEAINGHLDIEKLENGSRIILTIDIPNH